jgi:murein L,D-transpeptidase YafK
MTTTRRIVLLGTLASFLSACASKFRTYNGPDVTRIQVFKGQRVLQLLHNDQLLKSVRFELGFAPDGHKAFEGDGRTPEGAYRINRRNPNSRYHLSLGISYPNAEDVAFALANNRAPGGDIFIHGTPKEFIGRPDWTYGCIAVADRDMEDLYAMVRDGTPIFIYP